MHYELIGNEIKTILIGSACILHYGHTWSELNFGLWNPTLCYCMSRNTVVILTIVQLTTIYVFEEINWSLIYTYRHCILLSILALLLLLTLFLLWGSPMSISLLVSFWASSPLSFALCNCFVSSLFVFCGKINKHPNVIF